VDVRAEDQWRLGTLPGATRNVPVFALIRGYSPFKIARRALFALFGVLNGTEYNPLFLPAAGRLAARGAWGGGSLGDGDPEGLDARWAAGSGIDPADLAAALAATPASAPPGGRGPGGGPTVVLACRDGGTLEPTDANPFGRVSPSLVAAWLLAATVPEAAEAGRVAVLRGGTSGWLRSGRELTAPADV